MKKLLVMCLLFSFCVLIACDSNEDVVVLENSSVEVSEYSSEEVFEETSLETGGADDISSTGEVSSGESLEVSCEPVSEEVVENISEEVVEDSPIVSMDAVLYAQRDVNVRSGPGVEYEKVGALSVNTEVTVTGQDIESGWYQIRYNDTTAFVTNSYLGESKVVITAPANNTTNITTGNTNSTTAVNNTTQTNQSGGSVDFGFGYSTDAMYDIWQNELNFNNGMNP